MLDKLRKPTDEQKAIEGESISRRVFAERDALTRQLAQSEHAAQGLRIQLRVKEDELRKANTEIKRMAAALGAAQAHLGHVHTAYHGVEKAIAGGIAQRETVTVEGGSDPLRPRIARLAKRIAEAGNGAPKAEQPEEPAGC